MPLPWVFSLLTALGLFGFALAAAFKGRTHLARANRLASTQETPVAALEPGFRETSGLVVPRERTLESPLTRRACVYYRFRVQQRRAEMVRGSNGDYATQNRWVTVVDEKQAVEARVEDGGAKVGVDLWMAEMEVGGQVEARTGLWPGDNATLEKLLSDRYGQQTRGFVFNRPFRVMELVLVPGARVYVAGTVVNHAQDGLAFERAGELLVVSDRATSEVVRLYRRRGTGAFAAAGVAAFMGLLVATAPFWF